MRTSPRLHLLVLLSIVGVATGCPSDTNAGSFGSSDAGASGSEWSGDPCTLLTDADVGKLGKGLTIGSMHPNNVGSAMFSPDCRFYLQGDSSATVGVFVDKGSDFQLQKDIFKGEAVSGLGKSAWQGNAGGPGNSTVGVLLGTWSFRVDSTYELEYADLILLAKAIAARVK